MNILEKEMLEKKGGKAILEFAERMEQLGDADPKIAAAGKRFKELAKKDIMDNDGKTLKSFNDQLDPANPRYNKDLKSNLEKVLKEHPERFAIITDSLFNNPTQAAETIRIAANPAASVTPVVVAAAGANPAPVAGNAPHKPGVLETVVTAVIPGAQAATVPTAAPAPTESLAAKMDKLEKVPGYKALMDRIEKNPNLGKMFTKLMGGSSSDAEKGQMLDTILEQTKANPKLLTDLVDTIDKKPGTVSAIAGMYTDDPKAGMTALMTMSGMDHRDPNKSVFDFFGDMMKGGKGLAGMDFGAILIGIIGSLLGSIGKGFGGGNLMGMGNGGFDRMMGQMATANGAPASVAQVDGSGVRDASVDRDRQTAAGQSVQAPKNPSA